ncbi:DeoR family ulaG and ulaABCDEF operon transcriptional repressor [Novosphingobium chloroacetimidivorans]|uniref:DeoR family ulaG and ulaABCDEF operon transcriptional repressor n=1 Tax=Novosphingobium chloroacetimidivorans TaxID=1428314 RepID=A0A7W7KBP0_9SPHN|nr:DeoR/GlpR family DNA-binding transcription regulator [Novosphingobium chloroacetimidivorans]MBB4859213.1 DeoR family ulaG and ulaABCDEF operon transcriptional repressor [Novosphingobium chloroacetimidivorans]
MHAEEREKLILEAMQPTGFVSYRDLEASLAASPATIRRDLTRLEERGDILRVRGGAKLAEAASTEKGPPSRLAGTPFAQSLSQNLAQKQAIGRMAASLCQPGEGIMVDGGTTTLQMCPHLAGMNLQVLTNSLHLVDALLPQEGTRILLPSGTVFREQNIILAPAGEDSMPQFHAPKLFMGAASVGPPGVMQQDVILVAAERRLIDRAEEVILLIDSSKFRQSSGAIVCALDEIDVLITDHGIDDASRKMVGLAGIRLLIAE